MTENDLIKLRSNLPTGYAKLIQERLKKRYGKGYTAATIRRSFLPGFYNEKIIEEALNLIDETKKKREALGKRVSSLPWGKNQ